MAGNLPSTPQSAPPNFYSQVGQMAAGQQGGGAGAAGGDQSQQPSQPDPDQQFLEMVNKLLKVLQQMGDMKPRGQDITKYMKSMSDTAKDCIKAVYGGKGVPQAPGTDSSQSTTPQPPNAGGQPGTSAGAPPETGPSVP